MSDAPPPLRRRRTEEEEVEVPRPKKVREPEPEVEEEEAVVEQPARRLDAARMEANIGKLLKHSTFEPAHHYWLDTGSPDMNAALGSRKWGIPYGKMYEIRGKNHGGKTTLTTFLAGLAQQDGAGVGYIDVENSRDEEWAIKLGLDYGQVVKVYTKLVTHKTKRAAKKDKDKAKSKGRDEDESEGKELEIPRLQSAEELFSEAEMGMALMHKAGFEKQFWFLDSVANLRTEVVVAAGADGQNMQTKSDLSAFLSLNLPLWTGLAANYNALIVLINQIRTKPGVPFGDPTYSPGGNAFQHACDIRASARRVGHGKLKKAGQTIGMVGYVENFKNKAGRGSQQDEGCAYAIRWNRAIARVDFMELPEAERLVKA